MPKPCYSSSTNIATEKDFARGRNLSSLLQIQLPLESLVTSQNIFPRNNTLWTHETQSEPLFVKRSQISFKPKILFQASNLLSPRPPSSLGVQTESQDTLAPCAEFGAPDQKNELHNLSTSSQHLFGNEKTAALKFTIPAKTDLINCNLPAKDKCFTNQKMICCFTFSIKGW